MTRSRGHRPSAGRPRRPRHDVAHRARARPGRCRRRCRTTGSSWSRASGPTSSCSTRSCSTATVSALCRRLRALDPAPRVVLYTAGGDPTLPVTARVAGADGLVDKAAPADGALRGDPPGRARRDARCRRSDREQLDAAAHRVEPRTWRCWRCCRPHRARRTSRRRCGWTGASWRGASSGCWAACARGRARPQSRLSASIVLGAHASRPDGHRAHRPWRARIRHLLAAAQRADHLPRLGGRRSGREPDRRPDAAPGVPGPRQGHLALHQLARRLDLRRAWRSTTR